MKDGLRLIKNCVVILKGMILSGNYETDRLPLEFNGRLMNLVLYHLTGKSVLEVRFTYTPYNTSTSNNSKTEEFVLSENSSTTKVIENGFESNHSFWHIKNICLT